jgi:hypothetical protein
MKKARAKLFRQQVNSLLIKYDILNDESSILPKYMHLCMIMFIDNTSLAHEGEEKLQLEEQSLIFNISKCAREEREASALGGND